MKGFKGQSPSMAPELGGLSASFVPPSSGLSGTVKSWNGAKGFGFIQGSALGTDVMFSKRELPDDAQDVQGKFLTGRTVYFDAQEGPDGRQKATTVMIPHVEGLPVPGKIKSYSERHGWGFITSSALTEDVRFDKNSLAALEGMQPDPKLAGVPVVVEFVARPDGKLNAKRVMFQSGEIAERLGVKGPGFGAAPGFAATPGFGAAPGFGAVPGFGAAPSFAAGPVFSSAGGPMSPTALAAATGLNSMIGIVKQYSEKNGYGFLNASGYPQDIKFSRTELKGGPLGPGNIVSFSPVQLPDGRLQALNVTPVPSVSLQPSFPGKMAATPTVDMWQAAGKRQKTAEMSTGHYTSGTIKTYNGLKGFGFIIAPGCTEDVFFMRTSLPEECRELQGQDLQGKNVRFELASTPDGKLRAQSITVQ